MAPVAVYRVEHKTQFSRRDYLPGVYAGPWGGIVDRLGDRAWSMPSPFNDGLEVKLRDIFGFLDYASVDKWFADDMQMMREHGYTVRVYMVPAGAVRFGNTQVCFDFITRIPGGEEDEWIPVVERVGAPKGIPDACMSSN